MAVGSPMPGSRHDDLTTITRTSHNPADLAIHTELAAALARAEATWHSLVEEWGTKTTAAVEFEGERRVILGLKAQLDALSVERAARLQALAKPVSEAEQRLTYLAQFRIEDAVIFTHYRH